MVGNNEYPLDAQITGEADRDIQQLSERNSRLSGIFFIAAAIIGVLILLFTLLFGGGDDETEETPARAQRSQPVNEPLRLPEIVTRPPQPAQKTDDTQLRMAALELERIRQAAAARERAAMADAERRAELAALRRKKRESEMLVVDRGAGGEGFAETAQERLANRLDNLNLGGSGSGDLFGGGGSSDDRENQVLTDPNERFLEDASNTEVIEAAAVRLKDQNFLITQGTMLSGVLETAINSDLPGMTRALVDKPVYSRTGSQILIPRGSRLIGRYASGIDTGQSRIYIIWSRLERPDGVVIELGSPGTDTLGRSGLTGQVDRHFAERFGAAALLTAIGPAIALLTDEGNATQSEQQIIRESNSDVESAVEAVLEDSLDIPPTITVNQGTEIAIFVNRDLSFAQALSNP